LSSAGITRWGTQWAQVIALLKNEEVLRLYAADPRSDCKSIESLINDRSFWDKLRGLKNLLEPIHEAQKMSESTHSSLDKVYPRWLQIHTHLDEISKEGSSPWAHEVKAYMTRRASGWNERLEKQVVAVHLVAYILNPENRSAWSVLAGNQQQKVIDWLDLYGGSEILEQFYDYLDQENNFHPAQPQWKFTDKVKLFWKTPGARALAIVAKRLLNTTANSVASERAFSVQNLLHNKSRNRLDPERVNKLIYIYINLRSLKRDCALKKDPNHIDNPLVLDEDEELGLEDDLALPSILGKRKRSLED